jgi:hypothetical protein
MMLCKLSPNQFRLTDPTQVLQIIDQVNNGKRDQAVQEGWYSMTFLYIFIRVFSFFRAKVDRSLT